MGSVCPPIHSKIAWHSEWFYAGSYNNTLIRPTSYNAEYFFLSILHNRYLHLRWGIFNSASYGILFVMMPYNLIELQNFSSTPHNAVKSLACLKSSGGPANEISNIAELFLAPPAERLRSFCPSSVNFSLKGWFLKNDLITFVLFYCHEASLARYKNTVKIWIWFNRRKGQVRLIFSKTVSITFYLLWFEAYLYVLYASDRGWYWSTVKRCIRLNYSKCHFQGQKGQVWPIVHNYLYYSIVTKCCPNLLHHVAYFCVKPIQS